MKIIHVQVNIYMNIYSYDTSTRKKKHDKKDTDPVSGTIMLEPQVSGLIFSKLSLESLYFD